MSVYNCIKMESIPRGRILQIRPDTLEQVRKEYNLEKKGRMEEAVKMLDEWIQKQPHFKKKDFGEFYSKANLIIYSIINNYKL